ncbi:MAG: metallophosphoesterase [Geobacteraceae bacterium]|nr:metallophosphoesterase [Geobacteraceae bacterium]
MTKFSMVKYAVLSGAIFVVGITIWSLWSKRNIPRFCTALSIVAVCGVLVFVYATAIEPNWIAVKKVVINDSALAKSLSGLRVVQVSDIHIRKDLSFRDRQLISKINALHPDLLFITGDFLENMDELPALNNMLREITARYGVYGVTGNTDYHRFNIDGLVRELSLTGLTMLRNEHRQIDLPNGKKLWLAGVDDPVTRRDDLTKALSGIPDGEPVLLLAHGPTIFPKAVRAKVNLVLVGHTHGGQVGIPFLRRLSKYANRDMPMSGIVSEGRTTMFINRGIGTKTLPIRLFCRPEITVIEVR